MSKSLLLKPRLSEKGYMLSEQSNTYIFDVPKNTNRRVVAEAVASQYDVKVAAVKLAATAAKPLRSYRKRGRSQTSSRSGIKKAYVTLQKGNKLPLFAAENESSKEKK